MSDLPKYKFFQNELTEEWEFARYSNGKIGRVYFSTPDVKAGMDRIRKELEARGYQLMGEGRDGYTFSKPEYCKAAYLGTFLNMFTKDDQVPYYYNVFYTSCKFICVYEVYRHNGTAANASIRITVCWQDADREPTYMTHKDGLPFVSVPNHFQSEEIRKFKPSVSDKVLTKILDKCDEVIGKITLTDPDKWAKDPKDFPKNTEKEYKIATMERLKAKNNGFVESGLGKGMIR